MATKKTTEVKTAKTTKKTATEAKEKPKTAPKLRVTSNPKVAATRRKEPYVSVVSVELDPDNVQNGAFELDWNEYFVAKLVRAGYQGKDDAQIVDQWFQDICRNVLMENFEQWAANQTGDNRIVNRRDLGNGKTEVS